MGACISWVSHEIQDFVVCNFALKAWSPWLLFSVARLSKRIKCSQQRTSFLDSATSLLSLAGAGDSFSSASSVRSTASFSNRNFLLSTNVMQTEFIVNHNIIQTLDSRFWSLVEQRPFRSGILVLFVKNIPQKSSWVLSNKIWSHERETWCKVWEKMVCNFGFQIPWSDRW